MWKNLYQIKVPSLLPSSAMKVYRQNSTRNGGVVSPISKPPSGDKHCGKLMGSPARVFTQQPEALSISFVIRLVPISVPVIQPQRRPERKTNLCLSLTFSCSSFYFSYTYNFSEIISCLPYHLFVDVNFQRKVNYVTELNF